MPSSHAGSGRPIVSYEPSAFIGPWSDGTSSFACLVPRERYVIECQPPPPSKGVGWLADLTIGLTSVAMILSIPGLILYLTLR